MAYTTIDKSSLHFNTHLYSGNDTTNNQQVGLTPDLVWVKCRNNATPSHYWVDKVRGDKKYISSNATTAEQTDSNTFDLVSGGFNLAGGNGWTNLTGRNYVSWNWKASNATAVSNTDGSITSTVSANTTSGFSIVQWVGTGVNATIGHSLGVAPKCIIVKKTSGSSAWSVYHEDVGNTKFLSLNSTAAETTGSTVWNNTSPTSSVFSVGTGDNGNASGATYIGYFFAEKKGFSKFGVYTGNENADGTFVYTGFKPAFVIIKNRGSAGKDWFMHDNKRLGYNPNNWGLQANLTNSEATNTVDLDLLSNGFKLRRNTAQLNHNGNYYIYMAFAEAPLVGSNNVPCTAR